MRIGPDSGAMGNALAHGDGSLSKRSGSLNALSTNSATDKKGVAQLTHFEGTLDGLPTLNLGMQLGFLSCSRLCFLAAMMLRGEDDTVFWPLFSTIFRSVK